MSNDSATSTPAERAARRVVGQPAPGETERTVGQLVADASHDISSLIQNEIQLAKTEVSRGISFGGKGAAFLGIAAFLALLGLIFLFHTLAQVIAVWLPVWAGYLIVTLVLFLIAAVLGLLGVKAMKKAKANAVPQRAIRNAQESMTAIKPGS